MAPTLDSEPNTENCAAAARSIIGLVVDKKRPERERKSKRQKRSSGSQRQRCRRTCLGDGEVEVPDDAGLRRGGVAAGEAELDGAERDDERAEEGGDVGLAQDGHGGGAGGVEAGLARPHPHPVPAPAVGQQRLLQRAVVVAAALVLAAARRPAPRHGAARPRRPARSEIWFVSFSPGGVGPWVLGGREDWRSTRSPLNGETPEQSSCQAGLSRIPLVRDPEGTIALFLCCTRLPSSSSSTCHTDP
jgi:hypothetical protein